MITVVDERYRSDDPPDIAFARGVTLRATSPSDALALETYLRDPGREDDPYRDLLGRSSDAVPFADVRVDLDLPPLGLASDLPQQPGLRRHLAETVRLARTLWQGDAAGSELALVLNLPEPGRSDVVARGDAVGLAFGRGSMPPFVFKLATWMPKSFRGPFIGLVAGRGVARSQAAQQYVDDLRQRAASETGLQLQRLDHLDRGALAKKQSVVVLLHGLLASDVGTFDELRQRMRVAPGLADCPTVVGWPHNTLAPINVNALELSRLMHDVITPAGPRVAFVCHSRGGLVARGAILHLLGRDPAWRAKLRLCITFGTPHEGALLAEAPEQLLGLLVTWQNLTQRRGSARLVEALRAIASVEGYPGIADLRPLAAGGAFLEKLIEGEHKAAAPNEHPVPIHAVGGVFNPAPGSVPQALLSRALAGVASDLVVERDSTLSRYLEERIETRCSHSDYFDHAEVRRGHVDTLLLRLADALGCLDAQPAGDELEYGEGWVRVGGVVLERSEG